MQASGIRVWDEDKQQDGSGIIVSGVSGGGEEETSSDYELIQIIDRTGPASERLGEALYSEIKPLPENDMTYVCILYR